MIGANLFFNVDTFDIKIGDFGLSLPLNEELRSPSRLPCGTVQCMAYEVCRGMPYGRSADIWSLGCVVIHLLTGRMPWPNLETREQIIYKVILLLLFL